MGTHTVTTVETLTFAEDRRGTANAAAYFDGTGNLVEVAHAATLIPPTATVSFWFKTALADFDGGDGTGKPQTRFVMGLAAEKGYFLEMGRRSKDPTADSYNEIFLKLGTNQVNIGDNKDAKPEATSWTEVNSQRKVDYEDGVKRGFSYVFDKLSEDPPDRSYVTSVVDNKWTHFVFTIDPVAQEKTIYVNGVKWLTYKWIPSGSEWLFTDLSFKDKADDGSDWENPIDGKLALGYAGSKVNKATGWADYDTHYNEIPEKKKFFKGSIDQFRIFNVALTSEEVTQLYDNEK
jgi:hypothetical protein